MRYTFVKQHDATDCAAACLAMVCLHYKKETTITQLRDMMGIDLKKSNFIIKDEKEETWSSETMVEDDEDTLSYT